MARLSSLLIATAIFSLFLCETDTGALSFGHNGNASTPADYVDPFIGTGLFSEGGAMPFGNTYPGATTPFGMVQLSPDTGGNIAGYFYNDSYIEGFSHTHFSGTGISGFGNILVTAKTGELKIREDEYGSSFSHDSEAASPGYYTVKLDDYGIRAELTATRRAGMHRYTFPESDESRIIVDVSHVLHDLKRYAHINVVSDSLVRIHPDEQLLTGYARALTPIVLGKTLTPYTIYFAARISKPFESYGMWSGSALNEESVLERGRDVGAYITFHTADREQILVKMGISYVSEEQALLNLDTEMPGWDFEGIRKNARDEWNRALGKIVVEGGSEIDRTKFYTALYHALLMPNTFSDVNGLYVGYEEGRHDGEKDAIHVAEGYTEYATLSLWDTFRAENPLLTIIQPEVERDIVRSLIDIYDSGGWLPRWPYVNRYTSCMIGDHATAVIVDSYFKGIDGFDVEKAYEAMRKSATEVPPVTHDFVGRIGLELYESLGYVPYDAFDVKGAFSAMLHPVSSRLPMYLLSSTLAAMMQCVALTLEYSYDDWCLAQMAKELGREEDYELFIGRSQNYRNVFDNGTKFMRPKSFTGFWMPFYRPENWYPGFTEGNAWIYSWFVPQDVYGLLELMGKKLFIQRLDHFFGDLVYPGWLSRISNYWHGNEPDQHMPYLYDFVGQPWKTQRVVRRIIDELYGAGPEGIPGNDDCGQMSAWYVFSAMGFYPFCPGTTYYTIGSPIFDRITIHLDNGRDFVIEARNNSKDNMYVQRAELNGEPFDRTYLEHGEITDGGMLVFEMGGEPNTDWGSKPESCPPSWA